jgi:gas vesicle protein
MRFLLGFLLGMLIGASIALALAPQTGSETRHVVIDRVRPRAQRDGAEAVRAEEA